MSSWLKLSGLRILTKISLTIWANWQQLHTSGNLSYENALKTHYSTYNYRADTIQNKTIRTKTRFRLATYIFNRFGISNISNLTCPFRYSHRIDAHTIKTCLDKCTKKLNVSDVIKHGIKNTIRIVRKNRSSINRILVNNRNTNRTYTCLGHAEWHDGKHFQKRLRNFPGLIGKVGHLNAKSIPHPNEINDMEETLEGIAKYLNMTSVITQGIYRNGAHRKKNSIRLNDLNTGSVPIFDDKGTLHVNIPRHRFKMLISAYKNHYMTPTLSVKQIRHMNKKLYNLTRAQSLHTNARKWNLPSQITLKIIKEFDLQIERYTTPLNSEPSLQYYSENTLDTAKMETTDQN